MLDITRHDKHKGYSSHLGMTAKGELLLYTKPQKVNDMRPLPRTNSSGFESFTSQQEADEWIKELKSYYPPYPYGTTCSSKQQNGQIVVEYSVFSAD